MLVRLWNNARALLAKPLPKGRLTMYVGLASCVFGFMALYYAGSMFELQRRDLLLFELERRYREYQELVLSAECLLESAPDRVTRGEDTERLRQVAVRLGDVLRRRGDAPLADLLSARDEVLTVGSEAAVGLQRLVMEQRSHPNAAERGCTL